MHLKKYQQFLEQYLRNALKNTDGSNKAVSSYLWEMKKPGVISRHKTEKSRALDDLRAAFDEHQHWPLEIILSHLGIEIEEV